MNLNLKRVLALSCSLAMLASPIAHASEAKTAEVVTKIMVGTKDSILSYQPVKGEEVKPVIPREDALKIAADTFTIPESYGEPSSNYWQDQQTGMATWNFNWSPDTHPSLPAKFYLSIGVNANDRSILSYSWSDNFATQPQEPQYDRKSALPKAQEWLKKLVPEARLASLKLKETGREPNDQLGYTWIRLINDTPYYNNMVGINIDPITGELRNFHIGWEEKLVVPDKTDAISLAQAEDAITKLGVEVLYQDFYHRFKGAEARIIYRPKQDGLMIDAKTGQVIDWNGNAWAGGPKPVTIPASSAPVAKPAKPLTQEEALDLVRKVIGGDTLNAPVSAGSHERFGGKFESEAKIVVWNFSWNNEEKKAYSSVGVDATHGVVIEMHSGQQWLPDESYKDKTPIDEADARDRAIEAFVKIRPDLLGQVQLLDYPVTEKAFPPEYVQREYNFSFVRLVNGVRYPNSQVHLVIDRFSGELRNVYCNWSYKQLPSADGVITPEEALTVIRNEAPLELVYASIYPAQPMKEPVTPSIRLVYRATDSYGGSAMIDARNGHLIDYNGRDLTELRKGITDIAGLEAKTEIEAAVDRGVLDTIDGKFNPHASVKKGELAKALVTAFDRPMMYDQMKVESSVGGVPPAPSYSDVSTENAYAPYIDAAIQMGVFKPAEPNSTFNPEATVSKEEVALYTVRAMGYSFIDGFEATISSGYTDHETISEADRNAVGMLVGLKVLPKGGEFKPQTAITRADLARILVTAAKLQPPGGPYPYYRP